LEGAGALATEPTGPPPALAAAAVAWPYRGKPARTEVGPTAAAVLQSGFANLLWAALMA
jgi:hypothetical protein